MSSAGLLITKLFKKEIMNKEKSNLEKEKPALSKGAVRLSLPSDEVLIELAKSNCMMHKTSDELGFIVMFDLNDLRRFCTKLLKGKSVSKKCISCDQTLDEDNECPTGHNQNYVSK